ncbi:MAG TPA: RDD family protein [Acidimicrobiia bacterium]|nr:RDD family protein [Acidimicrobiia bacterium]
MTTSAGPSGPRASFGERFIAAVIDSIVVGLATALLGRMGFLGSVVGFVAGYGYYVYLEGSPSGQTVGKRAMSIRVVGLQTGYTIGYAGAFIRVIGKIVSAIPCLLGFLWMLWDPEKQTWHDKLAGAVVVPVSVYPVAAWPG